MTSFISGRHPLNERPGSASGEDDAHRLSTWCRCSQQAALPQLIVTLGHYNFVTTLVRCVRRTAHEGARTKHSGAAESKSRAAEHYTVLSVPYSVVLRQVHHPPDLVVLPRRRDLCDLGGQLRRWPRAQHGAPHDRVGRRVPGDP